MPESWHKDDSYKSRNTSDSEFNFETPTRHKNASNAKKKKATTKQAPKSTGNGYVGEGSRDGPMRSKEQRSSSGGNADQTANAKKGQVTADIVESAGTTYAKTSAKRNSKRDSPKKSWSVSKSYS